jgi:splicing factor 3B subunit 2
MKERMNPWLGRIDIDYQVLYDAFFKYQTKPELSQFGDIFYIGREEEQKMRKFRPGKISKELWLALGLGESDLPIWIYAMQ